VHVQLSALKGRSPLPEPREGCSGKAELGYGRGFSRGETKIYWEEDGEKHQGQHWERVTQEICYPI